MANARAKLNLYEDILTPCMHDICGKGFSTLTWPYLSSTFPAIIEITDL